MIFNINSTRGQTRFLTCVARVTCLVIITDVLTENIEKDPHWAMMFADDLVLCAITREKVQDNLETWRVVFESHEMKISRTKTAYLLCPTNDAETTVKSVHAELPTVTSFRYLEAREVHRLMSNIG